MNKNSNLNKDSDYNKDSDLNKDIDLNKDSDCNRATDCAKDSDLDKDAQCMQLNISEQYEQGDMAFVVIFLCLVGEVLSDVLTLTDYTLKFSDSGSGDCLNGKNKLVFLFYNHYDQAVHFEYSFLRLICSMDLISH